MLPVSLRKIVLLLLVSVAALPAGAQYSKHHNFDLRHWNLGFTVGAGYYSYNITKQNFQTDPITGQYLRYVDIHPQLGFHLGLITNIKIEDHLDFRFLPSVSLEQRNIGFHFSNSTLGDSLVLKKIENANLNLPLCLRLKSDFYRSYRIYFMGGIQYSINLASNKKVLNDPDLLKTDRSDVALIAAFGIPMYGEKVVLTPEFRFAMGLSNVYIQENTRFPFAISDLLSQALVLTVNFE